ncbi:MAG TPA: polyprenyl synthetase family protein [Pirellulales bacterium]|nr:polyprenyl synthetase family protein [Pirellulales bacterium]
MASTLMRSFEQAAQELRPQIEEALDRYTRFSPGCPATLAESMRYSLLAPGKRLRPLLVLMAADACGGKISNAMPAACAVEMIHCYSLIHDDLPAMDDDDLRRGRPTNHKIYGEAMAILAGDSLLTRAFEIVARDVQPPAAAAACCATLGEASGAEALVGGQADDIIGERGHAGSDAPSGATGPAARASTEKLLSALESIHERKTGAIFLVSLRLGGLTAAAEPTQIELLEEYGRRLGLAFQIADDLLDVQGNQEAAGKRVGKDADHGKLTFPGLLGIDESVRRAQRLVAEACELVAPLGTAAEPLVSLARYVVERDR